MRKELGFLAVLALYALIAYSTGITLPPDPWRSYICLLVLQSVLLWYSGPIGRRITDPVQNSGLTGPQQRLTNDIEAAANKIYFGLTVCAGTLVGIVAIFCCHESMWTGPRNVGEMVVMLITIGTECVVAGIFLGVNNDEHTRAQKALQNSMLSTISESALEAGPSTESSEETSALDVKSS